MKISPITLNSRLKNRLIFKGSAFKKLPMSHKILFGE